MEDRLRRNIKQDPLVHPMAKMHLLLREHGWVPDGPTTNGGDEIWYWTKPGCPSKIATMILTRYRMVRAAGGEWRAHWDENVGGKWAGVRWSPRSLEKRLYELDR
jgi:hypothetical protein